MTKLDQNDIEIKINLIKEENF
jgi:hypothetical protein